MSSKNVQSIKSEWRCKKNESKKFGIIMHFETAVDPSSPSTMATVYNAACEAICEGGPAEGMAEEVNSFVARWTPIHELSGVTVINPSEEAKESRKALRESLRKLKDDKVAWAKRAKRIRVDSAAREEKRKEEAKAAAEEAAAYAEFVKARKDRKAAKK
jgi:hypothetical protein